MTQPTNQNKFERAGDSPKKAGSKRKKLGIALICVISALILLSLLAWGLGAWAKHLENRTNAESHDFPFYPTNYEEDIFADEEWMARDLGNGVLFYYTDAAQQKYAIPNLDHADHYGEEVSFFFRYIRAMIYGDVETYNACYSPVYYEHNQAKTAFTPQKLYNIHLSFYSTETVVGEIGNYTKSIYILEYEIKENNGTLRNDFLNGRKPQYITVTDRDGHIAIDVAETATYR